MVMLIRDLKLLSRNGSGRLSICSLPPLPTCILVVRSWPSAPALAGADGSRARDLHLGLFRQLQGVVDFNPQVPHGTFEFRVSE